ncbi:hypothetical protein M0804_015446 [Polistes exclamans]|nr:hypothetical protein M0804_015446 [Polistes exclamans]
MTSPNVLDKATMKKMLTIPNRIFGKKQKRNNRTTQHRYETIERLNKELLSDESIRDLHQRRLVQKIESNKIQETDNVETSREKIKTNIKKAAEEALGKRKCNPEGRRGNTLCFKEVRTMAEEKKNAYQQYWNNTTTYDDYRRTRIKVNEAIRQIKRD